MGYFANGFVFSSEPDFKSIPHALPGKAARGYKHNSQPVWLLDLWKPRGKMKLRRAPFCASAIDGFRTDLETLDSPTREFLTRVALLQRTLDGNHIPCDEYVHLALAISAASRCPAFVFAADDDETDLAGRTVPGSLVSFGCRLDRMKLQYHAGELSITPLNHIDDGDEAGLQELVEKARSVAGASILPPQDIEGGQALYENPVKQWPKEAGAPAQVLGFGTWDPLLNVESDFSVVFEHVPQ